MKKIVEEIDLKIEKFCKLKEWEVVFWLNEKLCEARKKEKVEYFESITKMLPKAIILVFGTEDYRSVIFKITDKTYERVSEAIPERHPKNKISDREKMSDPIRDLIENKKEHIYIKKAIKDPRTQYMKQLIIDENINDIYYTRVTTPSGEWVIVVDGVGKKNIDLEKRKFLDSLGEIIQKIEEELDEVKKEIRTTTRKTRIGTIAYLSGLLIHLFRNKMMSIGGLCKRLNKTASSNGDNGDCLKCKQKTEMVATETERLKEIFKDFDDALLDIEKAAILNIEKISACELINDVIDIHRDVLVEVKPTPDSCIIATDKRKSVKAICRIIENLIRQNKNTIKISVKKQAETIKLIIKQENINTAHLRKIVNAPGTDRMIDHSISDFHVIISSILLPEMGVSLNVKDNYIELLFPQI
jgi:signal transduction histidine kinase